MKKIAILGSTGYIGISLANEFFEKEEVVKLFLFSRSKSKIKNLARDILKKENFSAHTLDEFCLFDYDVIINCAGIGNPVVMKKDPKNIFKVTEEIDNIVLDYLFRNPKSLYINLSSGAVYGSDFKKAITEKTKSTLVVSNMGISDYYSVAKINSEAKHRSMKNLNIVDLRVFSFFSRFVMADSSFLMSEIFTCIKENKVFKTNQNNIIRDYLCPDDLFSLLKVVMKKKKINEAFDVYSLKPVSKFELLAFLQKKYGLKYVILKSLKNEKSLFKNIYYSKNKKLANLGYKPRHSSLEGITNEINKILN